MKTKSADYFRRQVRSAITLNSPMKSLKVQHRLRVCTVIYFDQRDLIVVVLCLAGSSS
jgi:hypothetical protein